MAAQYNHWIVALSYLVAVIASYVALDMAARVSASRGGTAAKYWLIGGATAMGAGIWSMHFVGMLAFSLPIPVPYNVPVTLLSMLFAIGSSGIALHTISRGRLGLRRLLIAGVTMGGGVALMHYTGMAALEVFPGPTYEPNLFALSVVVAIVASIAAMWISFQLKSDTILTAFWKKSASALVMGVAIWGMHFTAMAAAVFAPNTYCLANAASIDNKWLAVTVGFCSIIFFVTMLVVSILDARLSRRGKALEAESERFFNQSLDLLCSAGFDGYFRRLNPAWEPVLGLSRAQLKERPFMDLVHADDRAIVAAALQRLQHGDVVVEVECRLRCASGGDCYFAWNATPLADGTGFYATGRDITDRRRAEGEVRMANTQLSRANTDLASATQRATEMATQALIASTAKSDFLANMSHEIRTPMNAIIGMADLLCETSLDERQRDYAHTIRSGGEHLLAIINDILDFSKIEAGKFGLVNAPMDLRRCVEDSLDLLGIAAGDKGVELCYSIAPGTPEGLLADCGRLRQILANYLSNAVKFTHQGEVQLRIESKALDERRREYHFAVRDTGIGIPPHKLGTLFKSFSQIDASSTRVYGGTGLGLAISRRIAEMMGGKAWAESEPGRGSTFHFTIVAEVHDHAPQQLDVTSLYDRRVLIVDDTPISRTILRAGTEKLGMKVEESDSAASALARIGAGERFDLMLIDYMMPEMDGVALAREIRSRLGDRTPPLVMVSAAARSDLAKPDFNAFLGKPIRQSTLPKFLIDVISGAASTTRGPAAAAPAEKKLHGLRILLVDDNPINVKVGLRMLESMGYTADTACDGAQAIKRLEESRYDLVLMDVQMPGMNGLEATGIIRTRWNGAGRPKIVAMTAGALAGDRERCLEAGMDDYIPKPIERARLAEVLNGAVAAALASAAQAVSAVAAERRDFFGAVSKPASSSSASPV